MNSGTSALVVTPGSNSSLLSSNHRGWSSFYHLSVCCFPSSELPLTPLSDRLVMSVTCCICQSVRQEVISVLDENLKQSLVTVWGLKAAAEKQVRKSVTVFLTFSTFKALIRLLIYHLSERIKSNCPFICFMTVGVKKSLRLILDFVSKPCVWTVVSILLLYWHVSAFVHCSILAVH